MNKVFLFALQLGVLAPFWRSMQALLWANSGRAPEGALWNIVYCGGPLLIACALARWRILKGKEMFSLIQAVCGVLLALLVSTFFVWVGASERGIPPVSGYGLAVDGVIYAGRVGLGRVRLQKTAFAAGRQRYIIHVRNRILICVLWMKL